MLEYEITPHVFGFFIGGNPVWLFFVRYVLTAGWVLLDTFLPNTKFHADSDIGSEQIFAISSIGCGFNFVALLNSLLYTEIVVPFMDKSMMYPWRCNS